MSNCKEEAIIKILGKVALNDDTNIDQLELRDILESVLNEYNVKTKETSLIDSDL